jgi:hypothetical protein
MWLSFNNAFLSVVHKDCADDELLVRARRQGDIERVFPGVQVRKTPNNDYLFRAVVKRERVAAALAKLVGELNYDNFKNSVREPDLHRAYGRVWHVMSDVQPGGPYAGEAPVPAPKQRSLRIRGARAL